MLHHKKVLGGSAVVILTVFGLLLLFAGSVRPAQAQHAADGPSQSCVSCHEDLYYLHDTGKWYCLAEQTDRCVNCHAGNAEAQSEADAHTGLIADPLSDGGVRCQTCHTADAQTVINVFVNRTGYTPPLKTASYVPDASLDTAALPPLGAESHALPAWLGLVTMGVFFVWLFIALRAE